MECYCDKNYSALIITGNPPTEVLLNAWHSIYSEFTDQMNDENHVRIRETADLINILHARIHFAKAALHYLQIEYRDDIMTMLKKEGIDVKLDPDDMTAYYKGLQKIVSKIKKLMLDLEEAHIEMDRMQESQKESGTNYDFFFDSLRVISKFQGYGVKPSDITVTQFTRMVNAVKKENQRLEMKYGN